MSSRTASSLALSCLCACSRTSAGAAYEATAPAPAAWSSASVSAEPAAKPERPVSLEQLIDQVNALIGAEESWRSRVAPVLPCAWPPHDACVLFLVYESTPLPTGTLQYRYRGPNSSVRCSLAPLACSRAVAGGEQEEFVEAEWSHGGAPDRAAQGSLIELLRAGQLPERVPVELGAYARWLDGRSGLGASARGRAPEFFAWLTASGEF